MSGLIDRHTGLAPPWQQLGLELLAGISYPTAEGSASATSGLPFRKIIWSLVSVATLRIFSLGEPVAGWLLHSIEGDGG